MAERLNYNTETDDRQVGDHLFRYWLACNEVENAKSVVDAGCGWGFGTEMLLHYALLVFAVDYNVNCTMEVFDKLSDKYPSNLATMTADLNYDKLPIADVLVAFEVIEHLELPINLINQFKNYKKVILSTPIIPTTHTNKYHKQNFSEETVLSWFSGMKIKWTRKQHDGVYLIVCAERLN